MKNITAVPAALLLGASLSVGTAQAADEAECIAPAKPGGGYDLTCRLAANGLLETGLIEDPMLVTYMPGGIGAVAYNHVNGVRTDDPNLIVAASTGAAVNLALGKFGQYDASEVRWVGALGVDYGAIVVKADAPWQTLDELMTALQEDPTQVAFGAGGSVGSQDWMKAALTAKAADVDPRSLRYVAFEGGGEALAALLGNHIQVFSGDLSELKSQLESGDIRVLAALSEELEAAGAPYEIQVYSGAPHAFTVFGSDRYQARADQASWAAFHQLLRRTLEQQEQG